MPKRTKVLEILDDECKCGEVVAHNRIADRILALFRGLVESKKKNVCDTPEMDRDENVTARCGHCFPCSYDQTLDDLLSELK